MSGESQDEALVAESSDLALKCGYRFEDETLVDEVLGEEQGERGALPLLAFAAGELWERRDGDNAGGEQQRRGSRLRP